MHAAPLFRFACKQGCRAAAANLLSFNPTVPIRCTRLAATEEHIQSMPLDYASHQIVLCQFKETIGTRLQRGTVLLA